MNTITSLLSVVIMTFGPLQLAKAQSQDETQTVVEYAYLNALSGADGGYCVVLQDEEGEVLKLITTEGAVSKLQISRTVSFISHKENTLVMLPIVATFPLGFGGFTIGLIPVAAQMFYTGYMFKHGNEEEETIIATFFSGLSIPPMGYVTEEAIRWNRVYHLINDKQQLTFTSDYDTKSVLSKKNNRRKHMGFVKLDLITTKLREITPKYPQGCDHISFDEDQVDGNSDEDQVDGNSDEDQVDGKVVKIVASAVGGAIVIGCVVTGVKKRCFPFVRKIIKGTTKEAPLGRSAEKVRRKMDKIVTPLRQGNFRYPNPLKDDQYKELDAAVIKELIEIKKLSRREAKIYWKAVYREKLPSFD